MQVPTLKFHLISCAWAMLVVCLAIPIGYAGDADEIRTATSQGDFSSALTRLETVLQQQPDDPELWFLKADTLHKAGQIGEAIATYRTLIDKFPEVPEAYNNLAILYANQGDYQKAASTLQQAFQTRPEYATAFENLMSIYDKMASDAYRKALDAPVTETSVELVVQDYNRLSEDTTPDIAPTPDNEQPVSSVTDEDIDTTVALASVESSPNHGAAARSQPGADLPSSSTDPCSRQTDQVAVEAADYEQVIGQNDGAGNNRVEDTQASDCLNEDLR